MGLPRPTRQPHRLADDGFLAYLPAAMAPRAMRRSGWGGRRHRAIGGTRLGGVRVKESAW
jgi:hypothetical protein